MGDFATDEGPDRAWYRELPDSGKNRNHAVEVLGSVAKVPVSGSAARRIATIADRQRGLLARRQLLAAGISSSAIGRLVTRGELIVVHAGVFAVGHRAPAPLADETAAVLAMRPGAALSHHSAGELWGFPPAHDRDGLIHVIVPGSPGGRPRGVRRHRSRILTRRDIRIRDGLPVTSPERTVLDLAATATHREVERTVDHALRTTPMTLRDLTRLLDRAGAHHGRAPLQQFLDARTTTTFTRSEAEERMLALVRAAGLPQPLVNVRRHGYEIDFLWPDHGVAVEVDGFATHGDRASFERDRRKGADLQAVGIALVRVTWRQLHDDALLTMVRLGQMLAGANG